MPNNTENSDKCIHGWDFAKKGQCHQCARDCLMSINWNYVNKEDFASLDNIFKAAFYPSEVAGELNHSQD